ncbi:MAG: transporter [Proteobacteria bacterium]|nr:MAG: transporter [Pseudomonadota bacterium]
MNALPLLVSCLVLGMLVARVGNPPAALAQHLNWWVLNIALTSLILQLIPNVRFDFDLWFLAAAMWLVFLGAWAFFELVGRLLGWSRRRIGALTLMGGLGNTAFVGFPMIEALRGQEGLQLALIADQAGCFIALAVGGTTVAAVYSGGSVQPAAILRRIAVFPPFLAFLGGITVGTLGGWPAVAEDILARLGSTLAPIALFSVGLQFRLLPGEGQWSAASLGLAWKLLLAPAIVYGTALALGIAPPVLAVAVLEAAMAPMITAAIVAAQHDLEPHLANLVLGVGVLISLVTVPLANTFL